MILPQKLTETITAAGIIIPAPKPTVRPGTVVKVGSAVTAVAQGDKIGFLGRGTVYEYVEDGEELTAEIMSDESVVLKYGT